MSLGKFTRRANGSLMATVRTTHAVDFDRLVGGVLSLWGGFIDEPPRETITKRQVEDELRSRLKSGGYDALEYVDDAYSEDLDEALDAAEEVVARLWPDLTADHRSRK